MAENQSLISQVHTLLTQPGCKRDGTVFESQDYTNVVWTRFQRGRPKKMGGYRLSFRTPEGLPRSLITQSVDGILYVYTGHTGGINSFVAATNNAEGVGPFTVKILDTYGQNPIVGFISATEFTVAGDKRTLYPVNSKITFTNDPNTSSTSTDFFTVTAVSFNDTPTPGLTTITINRNSPFSYENVWRYSDIPFTIDERRIWKFDVQFNENKKALQLIAHGGLNLQNIDAAIPQPIYSGNILPDAVTNTWTLSPIADTGGQTPTNQLVLVDGGVVSLYPFLCAFGSNGLILINNVNQDPTKRGFDDWNSGFANNANVSAGKSVAGIPLRGGSNSPSGLFWSVDSLIRVSFNSSATNGLYWSFDLLASKLSIMSSNSIAQIDGSIFWAGIDRFYVFNGNVQVLPNDKNLNYFFDNINISQRQKVFTMTVPRYNEVWWYYPHGTSTECNNAIIYNTKDKIWYDAGLAVGARRSAGYTTEVFPRPILSSWETSSSYFSPVAVIQTPSGQTPSTPQSFYTVGDATSSFTPGAYCSLRNTTPETVFKIVSANFIFEQGVNATYIVVDKPFQSNTLLPGTLVYATQTAGFEIWEHEFGVDRVIGTTSNAIYASFETNETGLVGGLGSKEQFKTPNVRSRIVRIEPDFLQIGKMSVSVIGHPYASTQETSVGPFEFNDDTPKIDIRNAEFRLFRFKFESNTVGGNFEMGRMLYTVDSGDERP